MSELNFFKRGGKFIFGMVHLLPLPGTARFKNNIEEIKKQAINDAIALEKAGVNAIIIENMGDDPFAVNLDTEQVSALAAISGVVAEKVSLPIGIDAAMNDYKAALSIAKAINADFVRIPVFVDTVEYTCGIISPCAREATIYRRHINGENIKILADIHVKHTHMVLTHVTPEDSAKTAELSGADAIIVTGTHIGKEAPIELIKKVKAITSVPIIAGSGVNIDNVNEQLEIADGAIVGSGFKDNGNIENPISYDKAKAFMDKLKG